MCASDTSILYTLTGYLNKMSGRSFRVHDSVRITLFLYQIIHVSSDVPSNLKVIMSSVRGVFKCPIQKNYHQTIRSRISYPSHLTRCFLTHRTPTLVSLSLEKKKPTQSRTQPRSSGHLGQLTRPTMVDQVLLLPRLLWSLWLLSKMLLLQ